MGDDYMINHQRMLQTGAALYEQPSEIGLPQAYMSSVTIGANLKVRSRKKNKINQPKPEGSGRVRPGSYQDWDVLDLQFRNLKTWVGCQCILFFCTL